MCIFIAWTVCFLFLIRKADQQCIHFLSSPSFPSHPSPRSWVLLMCMCLKRKRKSCSLYTLHPRSQNKVHSEATAQSGFSARDDPTVATSTSMVKSCASQVPNIESSGSAHRWDKKTPNEFSGLCKRLSKEQGKKMQVGQFSVSVLTQWSWTTQCVLSSFLTKIFYYLSLHFV